MDNKVQANEDKSKHMKKTEEGVMKRKKRGRGGGIKKAKLKRKISLVFFKAKLYKMYF
jgi:hypothetical protein